MDRDKLQKTVPHTITMKHDASFLLHDGKKTVTAPPRFTVPVDLKALKYIASNASSTIPPPLDSYITKIEQVKGLAHICPKLFELGNRSVVPISRVKDLPIYRHIPYNQRMDDISILVMIARENLSYYRKTNLLVIMLNIVLNTSRYLHKWIENDYSNYIEKKKSKGAIVKSIYDPTKQSSTELIRDPEYSPDITSFYQEHRVFKPELYNTAISILSDSFSNIKSEPTSILESITSTSVDSSTTSSLSKSTSLSSFSDLSTSSVSAELHRRKTMSESVSVATNNLFQKYNQLELQSLKKILQSTFNCQRIVPLIDIEKQLKRKHPNANTLKLLKVLADTTKCITVSQRDVFIDWVNANF